MSRTEGYYRAEDGTLVAYPLMDLSKRPTPPSRYCTDEEAMTVFWRRVDEEFEGLHELAQGMAFQRRCEG